MTSLVKLDSNQPADRFYRGGGKIRDFRSSAADGDRVPEDWVASTTTLFGEAELGLSLLPGGNRLADAIAGDPLGWLGPAHQAAYGPDPRLLVKLLDAGERLPVHVHPEGGFAKEHLGAAHGKAEAWYILEGGTVHLGFRRAVGSEELARWVQSQDVDAMMDAMHSIEVGTGDSVYVPPGFPHAIGAGIFLIEVQEPEDMSILLEWRGFAIDGASAGHLGIGFETALLATERRGWSHDDVQRLIVRNGSGPDTLAPGAARYFRAERIDVSTPTILESGFGTLVVIEGQAGLTAADGSSIRVTRGDTVLTSHAAGALTVDGSVSLLRCRPPAANAVGAQRTPAA
jgi:mannose-6-phosphate isomerase